MSNSYTLASEQFSAGGIDTEVALKSLEQIALSIHCWQGDDVQGFENKTDGLTGAGIAATGNYPGKPRTIEEFRGDFEQALELIPGCHRIAMHAIYADLAGKKVERSEYSVEQFQSWIDWCRQLGIGMDFNPSFFSHPKASNGITLTHADKAVRDYWIQHGIGCRRIAAEAGRQLGSSSINNFWIPDGSKDTPVNRLGPRERLIDSLDTIFAETLDPDQTKDAVESKLFGIGSESYVAGSHEFYLGYAITRQKVLCLDAGHYHPTEGLADKISSTLLYVPELLLHVSRGVRWDSDHVVVLDDPTKAVAEEVVRGGHLGRVHVGLDFFDASINRVAAWIIGARSTQKALLLALLQPLKQLRELEEAGDFTSRLALMEDTRSLPYGLVWEEFCRRQDTPGDGAWLAELKTYEAKVQSKR